jgi:hypothetical protein
VQSALIFAVMFIGVIAQTAAIWRCFHEGLALRHAAFLALTAVTLSREVVDLAVRGHYDPYFYFWKATQWPLAILGACAAIEAFWHLARHFRNVRSFGFILLGVISAVAALVALTVTVINSRWHGALSGALMFEECAELGLMLISILSLAFFRLLPSIPVRPNSIRHLLILFTLFGFAFAGNFVGLLSLGQWRFTTNLIITAGIALPYFVWAAVMKKSGETLPFPMPPLMSIAEIRALDEWDRRLYSEGSAVLREIDPP